jgi:hypothetical protein
VAELDKYGAPYTAKLLKIQMMILLQNEKLSLALLY